MKMVYKWMVRLIESKLKRIKERRDERFRQRIDRVYFRKDKYGLKRIEGGILLKGFLISDSFISCYGVVPESQDQEALALLKEVSDKHPKPSAGFDSVSEYLSHQGF